MKFSTRAVIRRNPEFILRAKPGPFNVNVNAEGSLKISCGRINAHVSRVPVEVRIPFLKRATSVQVASVGPCSVHIDPMACEINALAVQVAGVLAKDGMDCEVTGKVACNMEVDVTGSIPGRITKAAIEMAAEPGADE